MVDIAPTPWHGARMSDTNATPTTAGPAPEPVRFMLRVNPHLHERARQCADERDVSLNQFVCEAIRDFVHRVEADQHPPASTPQESLRSWADMGWRVMDESGSSGATYELSLMFSWPNMVDGDATVRTLRERLVRELSESGGRDPVTRLLAVGPMMDVTGTDA